MMHYLPTKLIKGCLKMKNKPWRITIDTNPDQCNLQCTMCDTHSIHNTKPVKRKRMSPEDLDNIIDQAIASGLREIIPSTMGEPLLYPYFDKFIKKLNGTAVKLNLTTNGTFPKKGVVKWASDLLPITSDTKISINGITPKSNESIMVGANTEEAIKNIKAFLRMRNEIRETSDQRPTVTLQVTFMKGSLLGIKEVIKFAIDHKVDRVKGHQLWVTHKELIDEDLRKHPKLWHDFLHTIEGFRKDITLENFTNLSDSIDIPDYWDCPFLGEEIWVDHEGNYNVCCAPSIERASLGKFGNIKDINLNEVFNTKAYQTLLYTYKTQPLCQKCSLRRSK